MKKLIGLIALTAIVGAMLVPATSASAAKVGAAAGECQVTLAWPGSGGAGDCTGLAVGGVFLDHPCLPTCVFTATVESYGEECFAGEPPLLGDATGELKLDGTTVGRYNWLRVGLVAVLTVNPEGDPSVNGAEAGAGVAAFVPQPPLGACNAPNPAMKALVVGAVVAAQG
ncbi:MAG TPA: hypothetical protein VIG64_01645 [Actinomycetota bacterium]|jgi:hypothetical protein